MGTRRLVLVVVLVAAASSCGGGSGDSTTTVAAGTEPLVAPTTADGNATALEGETGTTTSPAATTTSTTTTLPLGLPAYTIMARTGDDSLLVLLEPGTYSDIDLQNVVTDVVERFAPVNELHLVDDEAAGEVVLTSDEELTDEDRDLLDEHYFLRLEEGFRMIFLGPFESVGEVILGS